MDFRFFLKMTAESAKYGVKQAGYEYSGLLRPAKLERSTSKSTPIIAPPPVGAMSMADEPAEVTLLLQLANQGNAEAGSELFRQVQQQLHSMAERKLSNEQAGATILFYS
jgi:hypothetical protein